MARNRIIYQSEALYAGRDKPADGYIDETGINSVPGEHRPEQLQRVQSANYSFEVARQDVTQFGNLAAIDRVILEQPTVSLDFSYYLCDFHNEDKLGYSVNADGTDRTNLSSAIASMLTQTTDERNYYIRTVKEGNDASNYTDVTDANNDVIAIGNGFMSSYSSEGSVGDFATANVTVEALNMAFFEGAYHKRLPSVDPETGAILKIETLTAAHAADGRSVGDELKFDLPKAVTNPGGEVDDKGQTVIRPGDITLDIPDIGGTADGMGGASISDAKIQSYSLNFDLARTPLERLGSKFAFSREVDFPVTVTMSIDASLGDLVTGDLSNVFDNDKNYDLYVNLKKGGARHCAYALKGAKLDSQEFSSAIGDNKSVTLNFSAQIGSTASSDAGFMMSGATTHA